MKKDPAEGDLYGKRVIGTGDLKHQGENLLPQKEDLKHLLQVEPGGRVSVRTKIIRNRNRSSGRQ